MPFWRKTAKKQVKGGYIEVCLKRLNLPKKVDLAALLYVLVPSPTACTCTIIHPMHHHTRDVPSLTPCTITHPMYSIILPHIQSLTLRVRGHSDDSTVSGCARSIRTPSVDSRRRRRRHEARPPASPGPECHRRLLVAKT